MDDKRISVSELLTQKRQHWPESCNDSVATIVRVHRVQRLLMELLEDILDRHALQTAEFEVLAALRRQPPPYRMSPTELCNALLISSGGTSKILQRLQRRGLIERPPNPEDGRSQLVQLADSGKACIEAIMVELIAADEAALAALAEGERAQLDALLDKLLLAWGD